MVMVQSEVARVVFHANDQHGLLDVPNELCDLVVHVIHENGEYFLSAEAITNYDGGSDGWYAFIDLCHDSEVFEAVGIEVPDSAWIVVGLNSGWRFGDLQTAMDAAKVMGTQCLGVELKYSAICKPSGELDLSNDEKIKAFRSQVW